MKQAIALYIYQLIHQIAALPTSYILLAVLIVTSVMVLDSVGTHTKQIKKSTGIGENSTTVSVDGAKSLPVRKYLSKIQRLAGRPDALIIENGYVIPVERKPSSNKMRDRYAAQLLVYMRLVEEFEGKKPPYGYIILGPSCRRIKVENSVEKQAWLQNLINEMQGILSGKNAVATPHPKKCSKCEVASHCSHKESSIVKINSKNPSK